MMCSWPVEVVDYLCCFLVCSSSVALEIDADLSDSDGEWIKQRCVELIYSRV